MSESNIFDDKDIYFDDKEKDYTPEYEENIDFPKDRKIRTQPYDYSVGYIVHLINQRKIYLEPDFQRNSDVWDTKTKSLLIESILLNVPIPPIYVSEESDGTWNIIDGLQRLSTFKEFLNNEFKLSHLEAYTQFNKASYNTLPDKAKSLLDDGVLRIVLITKESDPEMQYDVFMRLNRGAVHLNEQELRNCLFRGELITLVKELCHNNQLQEILRLKKPHKRMVDAELILRYLAISEGFDKNKEEVTSYKSVMKTFINFYCKKFQHLGQDDIQKIRDRIQQTLSKVYSIFGKDAFRKISNNGEYASGVNKAIFDIIMVSFEKYDEAKLKSHKDKITELLKNLPETDAKFNDAINTGTSETSNLNYRLSTWIREMDKIINE